MTRCLCSTSILFLLVLGGMTVSAVPALAQPYGQPDRESPGDEMIQAYLQRETEKISSRFAGDVESLEAWQAQRPQRVEQYYYMLGLEPRPEKTPLEATVTGTFEGDGFVVDMLHYQSRPRLYVTGNLYRPAVVEEGKKLPAVFYVCGHSGRGRNGNKVAYQSHGIWFARHGYICLVVDTLQLGEIAAFHHGTYNLERWWWHARGYTPAGVEAWNGVRGIDYLVGRGDVDPERIAVTGISGGGAATFWVAAADERVKVAVPVSGMADLQSYVPNRVINGHCDCMFLYNTFQWPWTRIAGLVAPRAMLFVNSDQDPIFPMDANERIVNRLERLYSLYGAGDRVDAVVSVGGHAYRQDIRQAAFRFINTHLTGNPEAVTDSEADVVSEGSRPGPYPIPPEKLRVFPTDADLPADQLNTTADEFFVPMAQVAAAEAGQYESWKRPLVDELRRVSFGYFPESIPPAQKLGDVDASTERVQSEEGIEVHLRHASPIPNAADSAKSVLLVVLAEDEAGTAPDWLSAVAADGQTVVFCEPRGVGATKWTTKNPPNYVERCHVLLGRTVDAGRVWDVIAAAKYLPAASRFQDQAAPPSIHVAGRGAAGLIAAYAAVLDDSIAGVTLVSPPASHMDSTAPELLNVLRVCDVPGALGLVAPRPLTLIGSAADQFAGTTAAYEAADAKDQLLFK
ncbi:MAG: prolyl oligopeptidase family serine peptidase [Pirellulales bacterium]